MAYDNAEALHPSSSQNNSEHKSNCDQLFVYGQSGTLRLGDVFEFAVQKLLLRHIQQLICNAHAITAIIRLDVKV